MSEQKQRNKEKIGMKQNFIRTTDKSTSEMLASLGFQQVDSANGIYTFLNVGNAQFSENIDNSKIQYSNNLCI